jgi:hypothetical protein
MGYLRLNKDHPRGYKGPRVRGFELSAKEQADKNSKKLQRIESADKIFRKQTLESLTPGILGPSSPTKFEKNTIFLWMLI